MYYNLVVLLDGSDVSEVVLQYVPAFTRSVGAERVTLLTVSEKADDSPNSYLNDAATRLSDRWASDAVSPEISTVTVANGESGVAKTIADYADANDVDAIMLTTRGWSGADWWAVGSVAQNIVRETHVPVFAARLRGGRYPQPDVFKNVLVALDGSLVSELAIPHAEHIAHEASADLTFLHVLGTGEQAQSGEAFTEESAQNYLVEISERLHSVTSKITLDVRRGQASQQIAGIAQDGGCDLIIMTTHGHTGPGRGAFGGVTEGVLHGCRTPVLVVPMESKVPEV